MTKKKNEKCNDYIPPYFMPQILNLSALYFFVRKIK